MFELEAVGVGGSNDSGDGQPELMMQVRKKL